MSYYAMNGLGAGENAEGYECLTIPYKTNKGVEDSGQFCDKPGNCGDAFALQQVLNEMGFGPLDVDGDIGANTKAALDKAAIKYQVKRTPGTLPDQDLCESVGGAWYLKYYGGASTSKPTLTSAPDRTLSKVVNRLDLPAFLRPTKMQGTAEPGMVDKAKAWWGELGTPGKIGVVAGGVTVLGLLAYAITSKPGRQVEMQVMTPNRHKQRRKGRHTRKAVRGLGRLLRQLRSPH
jgi:hypothetical protein